MAVGGEFPWQGRNRRTKLVEARFAEKVSVELPGDQYREYSLHTFQLYHPVHLPNPDTALATIA